MNLPHNNDIERLVLGTIISDRNALDDVREILQPDCFFNPDHRKVYEVVLRVSDRGDRPDFPTIAHEMGGGIDLIEIIQCHTFDLYQHAQKLADMRTRRRLVEIGVLLTTSAVSEAMDVTEIMTDATERMNGLLMSTENHVRRIDDVMTEVVEQVNANTRGDNPMIGTPTGFTRFDGRAGGLQRSDLFVVAGETGQGKTAFALSMITKAAKSGAKVAIYSLEMKSIQLVSRLLACETGISSTTIMYHAFDEGQFIRLDAGIGRLAEKEIYFDERSTSNIDTIIASIRTMKKRYDIEGVMIDYLQILNVNMKGTNKEQQMGDVARRLKNLAKDLDIWVIALSQLNRDHQNPEPTLNRLRDSGQIAEAADIVCLVYRPEVYGRRYSGEFAGKETEGTAQLNFAKGRNIGMMKFLCGFDAATTNFYNVEEVQEGTCDTLPY
jgi:replicative DNA helicase